MPINIPDDLPAADILSNENIFVMTENRAKHQDIRPLRIAIMNLMPTKIATETQLLRLLGNTSLQVDITLLHPERHMSKNTSKEHLDRFYQTFGDVKNQKFDGLIITGAPVENCRNLNRWCQSLLRLLLMPLLLLVCLRFGSGTISAIIQIK